MKVKKYLDFIKESVGEITSDNVMELRVKFRDVLDELADLSYDKGGIGGHYFSDMCKRENIDLEADFKKLQNNVDKSGFTLEVIKQLFGPEADLCDQTFEQFIHNRNFPEYVYREPIDEKSGMVDYYLYRIAKIVNSKWVPELGGDAWSGNTDQIGDEEFFIRFGYGYHHTTYGQLYIEQTLEPGETLEEEIQNWEIKGYKMVADWLREYWNESALSSAVRDVTNWKFGSDLSKFSNWRHQLKFDDYFIVEPERIIFYLQDLTDDISKEFDIDYDKLFQSLYSQYVKLFSNFRKMEFINTGEEVMIRLKDTGLKLSDHM
jgi:hypothetical protein